MRCYDPSGMKSKSLILCATVCLLAGPARPQGDAASGKYANKELGVTFAGVYGWQAKFAAGSGAWTELARYDSDPALDARVVLQVRNNLYETMEQLRKVLKAEFTSSAEPTADKPAYKEMVFRDVAMKRGLKLKGIEVEGIEVHVTDEGKKRETFVMIRTYMGKNRLFRVDCSAKRSRRKRVKDRFDIAMASLVVDAETEKTTEGTSFASSRGLYRCVIPPGYKISLPARGSIDIAFYAGPVRVTVYSYRRAGELIDHRDQLTDFYGDDVKLEADDIRVWGTQGFRGIVKRKGKVTYLTATVRKGRYYRLHTTAPEANAEDAKRAHAIFEKAFRPD